MVSYDYLLTRAGVPPLLMAAGGCHVRETVAAEDVNDLVSGEPGRAPISQP